ncbi:MAG: DNA methyltransferase, partial [Acidimicrobiia bacterium]
MEPLRREWEELKQTIEDYLYSADIRGTAEDARRAYIRSLFVTFRDKLSEVSILDPACGSGNFLYVSLALLKALEKEVIAFAAIHGVTDVQPRAHPRQLFGLEISPYAVELASVVIWIGYLQWKHRNAMPLDDEEPILQPLDQVQLRDAIVDRADPEDPHEPQWPTVDVIVGNPPFLGGKQLRKNLGNGEVDAMFAVWDGRVARESDLCCYWFEKARAAIEAGRAKRVGLLATQGIRGDANRRVLERIKQSGDIFYAQADRKWIQDGVAVHVSMVGFDDGSETRRRLNQNYDESPVGALDRALPVEGIHADLSSGLDVTTARRLKENKGISSMGDTKV